MNLLFKTFDDKESLAKWVNSKQLQRENMFSITREKIYYGKVYVLWYWKDES